MTTTLTSFAQPQKPVLNHIALHVHNLDKSAKFYDEVIGLDTIPEPFKDGNHKWFRIGAATLHLIGRAGEPVVHSKKTYFCLSVASVTEFAKRLQNANVVFEDLAGKQNAVTTRIDGVQQIYFKDPDGYWIEVNDDRAIRKGLPDKENQVAAAFVRRQCAIPPQGQSKEIQSGLGGRLVHCNSDI